MLLEIRSNNYVAVSKRIGDYTKDSCDEAYS